MVNFLAEITLPRGIPVGIFNQFSEFIYSEKTQKAEEK